MRVDVFSLNSFLNCESFSPTADNFKQFEENPNVEHDANQQ